MWRRLVARYLGVVEAAGSSPVTQTKNPNSTIWLGLDFIFYIDVTGLETYEGAYPKITIENKKSVNLSYKSFINLISV